MSRWWAEPATLTVAAPGTGPGPGPIVTGWADAPSAAAPVEVALRAFAQQLQAAALPARSRVQVALSDELLCWALVPWSDELSGPTARQALARQCLAETYGEGVRGWPLSLDAPRWGFASLACAADPALADGVALAVRERGLRLASVQPLLVLRWNQGRQQVRHDDAWFVLRRSTGVTLLLLQAGMPVHLRTLPSPRDALGRLLERERFSLGLEAGPFDVYVADETGEPGTPAQPSPQAAGPAAAPWRWHLVHLPRAGLPQPRLQEATP